MDNEYLQKLRQIEEDDLLLVNEELQGEFFSRLKQTSLDDSLQCTDDEISHVVDDVLLADVVHLTSPSNSFNGPPISDGVKQLILTINNCTSEPLELLDRAFLFLMAPHERHMISLNEDKLSRRKQMENFGKIYPGLANNPRKNKIMETFIEQWADIHKNLKCFKDSIAQSAKIAIIVYNGHGTKHGLALRREHEDISLQTFLKSVIDVFGIHGKSNLKLLPTMPHKVKVIMAQCYSHLYPKDDINLHILEPIALATSSEPETKCETLIRLTETCEPGAVVFRDVIDSHHEQLQLYGERMSQRFERRKAVRTRREGLPPEEHEELGDSGEEETIHERTPLLGNYDSNSIVKHPSVVVARSDALQWGEEDDTSCGCCGYHLQITRCKHP